MTAGEGTRPRIAAFVGPTATIADTPPLVTSDPARGALDEYQHLVDTR